LKASATERFRYGTLSVRNAFGAECFRYGTLSVRNASGAERVRFVRGLLPLGRNYAGLGGMTHFPSGSGLPAPLGSRREFVLTAALAVSGTALGLKAAATVNAAPALVRPIVGFSKPFEDLSPADSAALVAEVGWNGIECGVRKISKIQPEKIEEGLPPLLEAYRRAGLDITAVVTDIAAVSQPHAELVLRTVARLGIKRVRLGWFRYTADRPLLRQVDEFGSRLHDLGQACGQLGLQAGLENHSGANLFSAPIWDAYTALKQKAVKNVGFFFDIAHAVVEGGLSWPIQARLAEPYYTTVYVKDFVWRKEASGWQPNWCPLGEGMVDRAFVTGLAKSKYAGPICQHHEYPVGDRKEMVGHMQRDLRVLQEWLRV
jgi:sugar phosphate isomerase/epimerase